MDEIVHIRQGVEIERTQIDSAKRRVRRFERVGQKLELAEDRALSEDELSELSALEGTRAVSRRLLSDLKRNRDFIVLEKPTATQTAKQVKELSRQVSALLERQKDQYR
ncbi:MAG: hypothetical protein JW990_21225 [Thermoleophilia bacterium]|nr:hypothetical protein [Thermoleophilia bacterium]